MKNLRKNLILLLLVVTLIAVSLFAVGCGGKKPKLSFETNGATAIEALKVDKEEPYTLPVLSRGEDYSFEGWYLTADFSGSPVTEVTLTEDTTVYAKWEKLYALNLNADGGNLSTAKLYLKKGANVYDAVSALKPTKQGFQFGAWFNGAAEVSKNLKMSDADLSLTAKYKAPYTIEVYKQNLTLDGYDKEETVNYEYIGKTVTYSDSVKGFNEVAKPDTLKSVTVSENTAPLKVYYDRTKVVLSFNPNYPDGSLSENIRLETCYGATVENVDDYYFECPGYYLKGWSTSQNGEVVYKSNFINKAVGDTDVESDAIVAERSTILYAVWEKGYVDMFGGEDYIFVEPSEGKTSNVYLNRGSFYFKGIFYNNSEDKTYNFVFEIDPKTNKELLGKTNSNGTFVYLDDTRRNYTSTLFVQGKGLDKTTTLKFDSANGVTYTQSGVESKGSYLIDETGMFVITYTEGALKDTVMNVIVGAIRGENAFQIRDEEEFAMGKLVRFGLNGSSLGKFTTYQLELTGFGTAKFYTDPDDETVYSTYYYTRDGEYVTLLNAQGQAQGVVKIMTDNGFKGYMFYTEALDKTIESKDGTWLKIDGLYNLTYFDGTNEYNGTYTYTTSVFGGYILSTGFNGQATKFLVTYHTEESMDSGETVEGEEPETTTVTVYEFTKKHSSYAEYYFSDNGSIYYAPLFVIDSENTATLYGYTLKKTYEKVATGTYEFQETVSEATGVSLYVWNLTQRVDPMPDVSATVYDLSTVKQVVFALDAGKSTNYNISYWYSVTNDDNKELNYKDSYTDTEGNTLVLIGSKDPSVQLSSLTVTVNGIAVYTGGGSVVIGPYTEQYVSKGKPATHEELLKEYETATDSLLAISTSSGSSLYAELNHVENTFLRYQYAPYNVYKYNVNGSGDANEYIALDGKGAAVYTVITVDDEGEETGRTTVSGSVKSTDLSSKFGSPIFEFNSDTVNFKFIQLVSSNYVFFSKYNYEDAACAGKEYVNAKYGTLVLDGFGYGATYTELSGDVYNGRYLVNDNIVTLSTSAGYRYFDVDGNSFTARGTEYGGSANSAYILFDNQRIVGQYIYFDGYGKAQIFKYETPEGATENQKVYVDENATYTVNGDVITINFTDGGDDLVYVGKISTFTYSSYVYRTFELQRENSIVKAYVNNDDWTVLILDDVGKAIRYQDKGTRETGTYKLITDTLLYYVNDEGTDACLYMFDVETGEIVLYSALPYNYYTEDLNTLIFTKYGFVTKNGVNAFYYVVDENESATIYEYDDDNPNANDYGFIEREFGTFDTRKTFDGETYYESAGYALKFTRPTENADKYPVDGYTIKDIEFSPVGGETYSVTAKINLGKEGEEDKTGTGTVVKNSEGTFLVLNSNNGQYQLGIDVSFKGTGKSSYAIKDMKFVVSAYSYSYINANLFYLIFGYNVPNTYGTIGIVKTYNEDGTVATDSLTATFGESCGYVDSLGQLLTLGENQEYAYDSATGIYSLTVKMSDGYDYELRFKLTNVYGISCYQTVGFIRCETLTNGDYTVTAKRIIASDYYGAGQYFDVKLTVSGTEVPYTDAYVIDGTVIYIVREFDKATGKVTKSTRYSITLVEKTNTSVEEEELKGVIPFESVTVVKNDAEIYYNEDLSKFVEIIDGKVVSIVGQKVTEEKVTYTTSLAKECEDLGSDTYKVTLRTGKVYTVTISDGKATITEVKETENE